MEGFPFDQIVGLNPVDRCETRDENLTGITGLELVSGRIDQDLSICGNLPAGNLHVDDIAQIRLKSGDIQILQNERQFCRQGLDRDRAFERDPPLLRQRQGERRLALPAGRRGDPAPLQADVVQDHVEGIAGTGIGKGDLPLFNQEFVDSDDGLLDFRFLGLFLFNRTVPFLRFLRRTQKGLEVDFALFVLADMKFRGIERDPGKVDLTGQRHDFGHVHVEQRQPQKWLPLQVIQRDILQLHIARKRQGGLPLLLLAVGEFGLDVQAHFAPAQAEGIAGAGTGKGNLSLFNQEFVDSEDGLFALRFLGLFLFNGTVPFLRRLRRGQKGLEVDLALFALTDMKFRGIQSEPGEVDLSVQRPDRGHIDAEQRQPQDRLPVQVIQGHILQLHIARERYKRRPFLLLAIGEFGLDVQSGGHKLGIELHGYIGQVIGDVQILDVDIQFGFARSL